MSERDKLLAGTPRVWVEIHHELKQIYDFSLPIIERYRSLVRLNLAASCSEEILTTKDRNAVKLKISEILITSAEYHLSLRLLRSCQFSDGKFYRSLFIPATIWFLESSNAAWKQRRIVNRKFIESEISRSESTRDVISKFMVAALKGPQKAKGRQKSGISSVYNHVCDNESKYNLTVDRHSIEKKEIKYRHISPIWHLSETGCTNLLNAPAVMDRRKQNIIFKELRNQELVQSIVERLKCIISTWNEFYPRTPIVGPLGTASNTKPPNETMPKNIE